MKGRVESAQFSPGGGVPFSTLKRISACSLRASRLASSSDWARHGGSVRFGITGSVTTSGDNVTLGASGSSTTNGQGQAAFCYTSELPGENLITAFADTINPAVSCG